MSEAIISRRGSSGGGAGGGSSDTKTHPGTVGGDGICIIQYYI